MDETRISETELMIYLKTLGYKGGLYNSTTAHYRKKFKGLLFEMSFDREVHHYCTLRVFDTDVEVIATFNIHFATWKIELEEINDIDWEKL